MFDLMAIPLIMAWVGAMLSGVLIPIRARFDQGAPGLNVLIFAAYVVTWLGVASLRSGL